MVEEKIIEIYPSDKIQSPVHLSIGQEAVAVGICNNLLKTDLLYSSYRSHAYYLAKGANLNKMFAELYGKVTGCGKGKAGSMHLAEKSVGFMGSSAVVASTISHAVGSALASKRLNKNQVCVATFGDGASEEGSYHESLNFASVFKLPVLFVCENNGLAIHSTIDQRHSYKIHEHAKSYNLKSTYIEEGYDFMKINSLISETINEIKLTGLPQVVEIKTYRYKEHVGIGDDHHVPYRSSKDFDNWKSVDPLIQDKTLINEFSEKINAEIEAAVNFAEQSEFPADSELFTDIY
ncbi:MAG: thiamine pyrophosphate-dependent dehydrogenase E1 component subunit alpha [Candidatus Sericytochromatia bacterium]|nr:thiamine pyrophosphate-dependent dehydrogenase E1 component subunit alpha [Candidatus Sericytochromatia bacterium]